MIKYEIALMSNHRYRLFYYLSWFPWYKWSPTFGDGCGNDTGVPVEYDTVEQVSNWLIRRKDFEEKVSRL